MSAALTQVVATEPSNATGYRAFKLGDFELSRDEYFVPYHLARQRSARART